MKLFGLIGFPLSHSFSEKYFSEKFVREKITDFDYKLFPLENLNELPKLIELFPELSGFNVTIPYKEQIIDLLDDIDDVAKTIGAVNLVTISKSGNKIKLKGYNTDYCGFIESLTPFLSGNENKALILGTGGASKSVQYGLKQLKINYTVVTRKPFKTEKSVFYSDLDKNIIENHQIIINTTPLGMYPETTQFPDIPYEYISENHILFDLIYNPSETQFLKFGKYKNAKILNGFEMLIIQAEKSWKIFKNL